MSALRLILYHSKQTGTKTVTCGAHVMGPCVFMHKHMDTEMGRTHAYLDTYACGNMSGCGCAYTQLTQFHVYIDAHVNISKGTCVYHHCLPCFAGSFSSFGNFPPLGSSPVAGPVVRGLLGVFSARLHFLTVPRYPRWGTPGGSERPSSRCFLPVTLRTVQACALSPGLADTLSSNVQAGPGSWGGVAAGAGRPVGAVGPSMSGARGRVMEDEGLCTGPGWPRLALAQVGQALHGL